MQRPGAMPAGELPMDVHAAMAFVRMCNEHASVVGFHDDDGYRMVGRELPIDQDRAFRMACRVVGKYFSRAAKGYE